MDNVTHSLAAMLLAEGVVLAFGRASEEPPRWRTAAFGTSLLAHNLPDLDFLLTPLTGGKIGYLLHHRGHTHTLAFAACATLLFTAVLRLWAVRGRSVPHDAWRPLSLLAGLGLFAHVLLDYTNNYGVHPFWPIENRWIYGDTIFIIEPWLWVVAVPPLIFVSRRRTTKVALGLILSAGLTLTWWVDFVRPLIAAAATVAAILLVALLSRASRRTCVATGLIGWLAVSAVFTVAAVEAREAAAQARAPPEATVHDFVLAPRPGDPLCFALARIETEAGIYRVRTGMLATWPVLTDAGACADQSAERVERTAPLRTSTGATSRRIAWSARFEGPVAELRALARDCRGAAFLRFARVPFWVRHPDRTILGDLRYDREEGLGFAEIELVGPPADCPTHVPAWVPPRADILRPVP